MVFSKEVIQLSLFCFPKNNFSTVLSLQFVKKASSEEQLFSSSSPLKQPGIQTAFALKTKPVWQKAVGTCFCFVPFHVLPVGLPHRARAHNKQDSINEFSYSIHPKEYLKGQTAVGNLPFRNLSKCTRPLPFSMPRSLHRHRHYKEAAKDCIMLLQIHFPAVFHLDTAKGLRKKEQLFTVCLV